ncbi:GDSL-type esterase/lipase family protein [Litorimonas haliclonae]|uniref:GDSL-type esterase/lipase family protein n=1 Tax=Litorimonas haliclonae TaxID=2081977 RepID=UPI0039EF5341
MTVVSKSSSAAFLAFAGLFLWACQPQTLTAEPSEIDSSERTAVGSFRPLGRYVLTESGGYQMGWPASGLALTFHGKTLTSTITDSGEGIMDLSVNGQMSTLELGAGTNRYTLIESPTKQTFDVKLTRRTESYDTGLFTIESVQSDGEVLPTPAPKKKILFLGDSITAGFGLHGDTKDCAYAPKTNAPLQSYAKLAAGQFGAEVQLIAISGRGVVHNWDDNPAPVMPLQIDSALPDNGEQWDDNLFRPDVIVAALGTNDWSVQNPGMEKFRLGYKNMLRDLRAQFPRAHIVTVSGPLLEGGKREAAKDGINWAMNELRDPEISTVDLTLSETGLKWACQYHPGRDSMKNMANQLGAHIADQMDWTYPAIQMPIKPQHDLADDGKKVFTERLSEIRELPELRGGTLLAGDSITQGWRWQKNLLDGEISNHGIGWDTAVGLHARLPEVLRHRPDQMFILIGTNDIGYGHTAQQVAGPVKSFIERASEVTPETKIYLQSILPRESGSLPLVQTYNDALKSVAAETGVEYLDLTANFAAQDGTLRKDLSTDGLHLNEDGYKVWADILNPIINSSHKPD